MLGFLIRLALGRSLTSSSECALPEFLSSEECIFESWRMACHAIATATVTIIEGQISQKAGIFPRHFLRHSLVAGTS